MKELIFLLVGMVIGLVVGLGKGDDLCNWMVQNASQTIDELTAEQSPTQQDPTSTADYGTADQQHGIQRVPAGNTPHWGRQPQTELPVRVPVENNRRQTWAESTTFGY